jgi:flagellar protein FlgJ
MMQLVSTGATGASTPAKADPQAKLKSAAQAFEAVFLRQVIGSMRSASLGDGMFDSQATEQFQDMADSQTADSMSQKGVLHIADMLVKQLSPVVAKQSGGAAPTAPAAEPETAA